jgi:transcriptional regulator with GAF, ATPase, and Fis domain
MRASSVVARSSFRIGASESSQQSLRVGELAMSVQLIGKSDAFREVTRAIGMVAAVDSAVLLQGETGTGKEVVARAIHDSGPRRTHRFVAVNCAAIPSGLLESELFGYERGAFTGAVSPTIGRFQSADRGTLFLDEVGDLPLELQAKLLRVLQERQIERLGSGGRIVPVDVRIIAATNQPLWEMVQRREFRADLYYRLNVFPIVVPPLRERGADIRLLVEHFVRHFAGQQEKNINHIPDVAIEMLRRHPWPGNIRELQNVIERAVVTTRGDVLELPGLQSAQHPSSSASRTLAQVEREHILATLHDTNGVIGGWNGAAARLGLSRTTLIARMQRLGISKTIARRSPRAADVRTSRALTAPAADL